MPALQGAWRYRVSAGTGWPGVSMLLLSEIASFILQLLPQCGSLGRFVPEMHWHYYMYVCMYVHWHVAGTNKQQQQRLCVPCCVHERGVYM